MKPEAIIELARRIEGLEQIEYCLVAGKTAMAFIFRANGDQRYGTTLPIEMSLNIIEIERKAAKKFLQDLKKLVNASHDREAQK